MKPKVNLNQMVRDYLESLRSEYGGYVGAIPWSWKAERAHAWLVKQVQSKDEEIERLKQELEKVS